MAAAVHTNLSVAFTHGAQLTMGHCVPNPLCSHPPVHLAEPTATGDFSALPSVQPASLQSGADGRRLGQRGSRHLVCVHTGNPGWGFAGQGAVLWFVCTKGLSVLTPTCELRLGVRVHTYADVVGKFSKVIGKQWLCVAVALPDVAR